MFSRNNRVQHTNGEFTEEGVVLGIEDFEGYKHNNPSKATQQWELVQYESGYCAWTPITTIAPLV